jgi:hypothetical protein
VIESGGKQFFFGNCPGSRRQGLLLQQKTFGRFDFGAAGDAQPRGSKVLVLFFKKEPLSSACLRFGWYLRPTWAVTFSEKKNQKTFTNWARSIRRGRSQTPTPP